MVTDIDKRAKNTLILSLGGNVGNVTTSFAKAIAKINQEIGEVVLTSSVYQTKAWGHEAQADFFNQVIQVETVKKPVQCLQLILEIETSLGRLRTGDKWRERIIDIDILFYNQEQIDEPHLKIPHPYIHQRNFILTPLAEICAEYIHPVLHKSIAVLEQTSMDKLKVVKI